MQQRIHRKITNVKTEFPGFGDPFVFQVNALLGMNLVTEITGDLKLDSIRQSFRSVGGSGRVPRTAALRWSKKGIVQVAPFEPCRSSITNRCAVSPRTRFVREQQFLFNKIG
jgi:hypothetical protein